MAMLRLLVRGLKTTPTNYYNRTRTRVLLRMLACCLKLPVSGTAKHREGYNVDWKEQYTWLLPVADRDKPGEIRGFLCTCNPLRALGNFSGDFPVCIQLSVCTSSTSVCTVHAYAHTYAYVLCMYTHIKYVMSFTAHVRSGPKKKICHRVQPTLVRRPPNLPDLFLQPCIDFLRPDAFRQQAAAFVAERVLELSSVT